MLNDSMRLRCISAVWMGGGLVMGLYLLGELYVRAEQQYICKTELDFSLECSCCTR